MSAQTKSFVFLILVAAALAGVLFYFAKIRQPQPAAIQAVQTSHNTNPDQQKNNQAQTDNLEAPPTNVADWQEYSDPQLKLSFKYPKNWTVRTAKAANSDYDVIVIDPGQDQDHLRIYADEKTYFATDGLVKEQTKIAGQDAWTVSDILYGVKTKSHFFTFDLGANLRLKPTFKAIMSTVAFSK